MTTLRTPAGPAAAAAGTAPPADRGRPPGWRDPRLVAGVVIVAVCVLLGARVLSGADDTTAVWTLRHDVPAGTRVGAADVAVTRVRLSDASLQQYVRASGTPASFGTATHDLVRGELLARSSLTSADRVDLVEVPLSVAPDDLPASVREGSLVDVWVTPKVGDPGADRVRAKLALDDVVVVAVPRSRDSLAPRTTQQVIVGVDDAGAADLADALGALADGRVVLTRQAGS